MQLCGRLQTMALLTTSAQISLRSTFPSRGHQDTLLCLHKLCVCQSTTSSDDQITLFLDGCLHLSTVHIQSNRPGCMLKPSVDRIWPKQLIKTICQAQKFWYLFCANQSLTYPNACYSQATTNILLPYEENAFATDKHKQQRGWGRETVVHPENKKQNNKNSPQPSIADTRCAHVHMA